MLLKNVKVMWTKIGSNPDSNYNEDGHEWTIDCLLNEEQATELTSKGVQTKTDPEGRTYVRLKRPTTYAKSGDPMPAPKVVDKFGEPHNPDNIGNESVCNVQGRIREWEYKKKSGVSFDLVAVQVMELNEYSPDATVEFEYEEKKEVEFAVADDDEDIPF